MTSWRERERREREKRGFRRQDFVNWRVYRRAMARTSEVDARQGAYGDPPRVRAPSRADRAKVYPAVPRGQENCYPEGISPADACSDGAVGVRVAHAGQRRGYTLQIRFSPTGQDRRGPRRPASPSTSIEVPRFPPKSLKAAPTAQACLSGVHRARVAVASQRPSIYPLDKDFPVRESRRRPAEACSKIHRLTFPPLDNFCLGNPGLPTHSRPASTRTPA